VTVIVAIMHPAAPSEMAPIKASAASIEASAAPIETSAAPIEARAAPTETSAAPTEATATARSSCENWSGQYGRKKATQEK